MAKTIFDFTVPGNYTLNKVGITNAIAALLATMPGAPITHDSTFTTPGNYTYDNTVISISGGHAQLVDRRPTGATLYDGFDNASTANWGSGVLTRTLGGTAALLAGALDLRGGVLKYASYAVAGNAAFTNLGTIAMDITPNYSGNPVAARDLFAMGDGLANLIQLRHQTNGTLLLEIKNSSNVAFINYVGPTWTPVASTKYNFEVDIDIVTGATRIFINGTQYGVTQVATGSRDGTHLTVFTVGTDSASLTTTADMTVDNIVIWNTVQHTANFTPPAPPVSTIYVTTNPTIDLVAARVNTSFGISALSALSATFTASGADTVQFSVSLNDGVSFLYWNGMAWVTSSSYAQTNTIATILANAASLDWMQGKFQIRAYLHSATGATTPDMTDVSVTYVPFQYWTTGGSIQSNSGFTAETITSFLSTFSASGSDLVKFGLVVNNVLKYWNGSAWVNSNGSIAQTNLIADIQANRATLLSVNSTVEIFILLASNDGSTTPNVTDLTIGYDFGAIEPALPATCDVFGFIRDIQCNPVVGAQVIFSLVTKVTNGYMEAAHHVLFPSTVTAVTDANGYFQATVLSSPQFEGTNTQIQVVIKKSTTQESADAAGTPLVIQVPNQLTADITDLLTAS